ncbi:hypothetical protein M9H77_12495 [Catharanthus roseus]|uniref:Uncharacterized protein n=1 Tax=Catharanthus roseus TaxID=4058 RepID=A0ACC0BHN9_CATRO|nr:hypothetical protein M9H77_12495 [Catharanthus roseus]
MKQDDQGDEELQGLITRGRARRIKENNDKVAHGLMISIEETMKEGVKFKNESLKCDGNPHKLLIVHCLNIRQLMEQVGREINQEDFIMSTDAQLLNPQHEGASESPHSNLDPMRIIMQELQSIKREIGDMGRDITNLSIEQRYESHIEGNSFGTPVQGTHQFYDGGRYTTPRGGRTRVLGGRGYNIPQEEVPRHEAWNEDNLCDNY